MEEVIKKAQEIYSNQLKKKDWRSVEEIIDKSPSLKKVLNSILKKQEIKQKGIYFRLQVKSKERIIEEDLSSQYKILVQQREELKGEIASLSKRIADLSNEKTQISRKYAFMKFFFKQEYLKHLSLIKNYLKEE
jgi:hypothetical protein